MAEAGDRYRQAERARAELEREVSSLREGSSFQQLGGEAAAVLQEAGRSGEQLVDMDKARRRAETIIDKARQQAEQLRAEVTSEAQKVLAQAREVPDQVRREVEQERAALQAEREQVRELRDGLVGDLGRVHGAISALLERTGTQPEQALTTGSAVPKAVAALDADADKPVEPAKVLKGN